MSCPALRLCGLFVLLWLWAGMTAAHAETVTLERDSVLRAEPRTDAAAVASLTLGTTGEALSRQGAWVQIRAGTATGWLYSFNVRFGGTAGAAEGAGSVLGRIFGPRQRISVTSTIGIRGLDEEDLKQARFDEGQVRQLDGFAATREQAEAHAADAGIAASRVDYLGDTPAQGDSGSGQ
jgi:hypothetical protein